MKKLIFKSFLVAMIFMGIANYFIYLNTGQLPLKNLTDKISRIDLKSYFSFSMPDIKDGNLVESGGQSLNSTGEKIMSDGKTRIYKWTDAQGVVHYDQNPPSHSDAQEMTIDPDINLVEGLAPEDYTMDDQKPAGGYARLIEDGSKKTVSGVNPDSPPMEQALQAKELLEQRDREQQKILDSL